ncbi:MAG: hypothetical protein KC550_03125, partial [Nanoarchaeota archaeon]|nr:hypothetical protein [Nanoarchaeota archaeon]
FEQTEKYNISVLLIEHDRKKIFDYCNRVIYLNRGKIVSDRELEEFKDFDSFNDYSNKVLYI